MNPERDQLERVLERLAKLKAALPAKPADLSATVLPEPAVVAPHVTHAASSAQDELGTVLELLSLRDRHIQTELLKLQRTLSRQNFRGAESARRLVRRLARRAEQNVADAATLLRARSTRT